MNDRNALLELVQRYADGLATADEVARLQVLLRDDAAARREFRHSLLLDAELARLGNGLSPDATVPQLRCTSDLQSVAESVASFDGRQVHRTKTISGRRQLMGLLVALCVVIVTGRIWFYRGSTTAWSPQVACSLQVSTAHRRKSAAASEQLLKANHRQSFRRVVTVRRCC